MPQPSRFSTDADADTHVPLAGAAETFSAVVKIVERFTAHWEVGGAPPCPMDFLPEVDPLRQAVLPELIRADLEQRLRRKLPLLGWRDQCRDRPEFADAPPIELLLTELDFRRRAGESLDVEALLGIYPQYAERLRSYAEAIERHSTMIAHPGAADDLDDIDVGQAVDDFDLLAALGRGAFARVFLARQRSMQRLVAVKISHIRGTEPQTLAQLDHDFIVRVFDQHELPDRQLRLLYMQYLPGGTLESVVRRVRETPVELRSGRLILEAIDAALESRGETRPAESASRSRLASLSWPEAVAWLGSRLALALDYAAEHGVLHRDVKPANVLLTAEGLPKLADFNISFSEEVQGATPAASFGGSLNYMSPEQLAACDPSLGGKVDDLDGRSDLFSLGVLLWELLTGGKPYVSEVVSGDWKSTVTGMLAARRQPIAAEFIAKLPADLPATLRRVLLKSLSPERNDRWPTGRELSGQLELCLDPQARDLVDPPPESWRFRLRPWRVPLLVLSILGPNGLSAVYNYHHNRQRIISQLTETAIERFEFIQTVVNGVAFPLGVAVSVYLSRRVLMIPRRLKRVDILPTELLTQTRIDVLRMSDRTVLVCLLLWVIAGITYPIAMEIAAGGMPSGSSVHFLGSLFVCGLIATAYPFFAMACYAVRSLYPELLPYGIDPAVDGAELRRLSRHSTLWLALAASVPLLAIAGLTFVVRRDVPEELALMRIVCGTGIIGFGAAYWLSRRLEEDLRALLRVVSQSK